MLRSVEITAVLALPEAPFHSLHWRGTLALSLDCFVCQRTGRTTALQLGAERAVCSGDDESGEHYAAARLAAFDHTTGGGRTSLRVVVDYWWAPFHDEKRNEPAAGLTREPWVRHHLGYHCPERQETGLIEFQTNAVRPASRSCRHCSAPLVTSEETPRIRLLT